MRMSEALVMAALDRLEFSPDRVRPPPIAQMAALSLFEVLSVFPDPRSRAESATAAAAAAIGQAGIVARWRWRQRLSRGVWIFVLDDALGGAPKMIGVANERRPERRQERYRPKPPGEDRSVIGQGPRPGRGADATA